ncbi:MAG: tripartite tricarboxylate transporter TctB family protein [Spirochaetales bacterium]|nr:tripartite tricarboxylate transporter TctB family protein [Spirochaetales bacterium]
MKVRTNLAGGIIFIVFGTILLLLLNTQVITYGNIAFLQSAKVAPFFAEIIMITGGILLVIQSLVFKKEKIVDINLGEQKFAIATLIVFCLFAAAIYYAGFIIGSLLFVVLMFVLNRNKSIPQFIGLSILAIGIYFLFTSVFYVQLPGVGGVN